MSTCKPGPLPILLGCDDCESWSCALLSLAVIVIVPAIAVVFFCLFCTSNPNKAEEKEAETKKKD